MKKLLSQYVWLLLLLLLLCGLLDCQTESKHSSDTVTTLKTGMEPKSEIVMNADYQELFYQAKINTEIYYQAESIVYNIIVNRNRYWLVEYTTKVPWFVVSCIHSLESSLNFNTHLFNGDPLTARTVHVPRGRPLFGEPPFTWEDSAMDALSGIELWKPKRWNLAGVLEFMERYNGLGYANKNINTPYLWSGTSLYTKGLFVSDDKFDADAVSKQVGAAILLKLMVSKGYLQLIKGEFL